MLFNYTFSIDKSIWIYRFIRLIQAIALFAIFLYSGKKKSVYSAFLWGILLGSIYEITLSLLQLTQRHSLQGLWYYFGERQFSIATPGIAKAVLLGNEFLRPYGTFSHPNSLAGFYLLIHTFVLTEQRIKYPLIRIVLLCLSGGIVLLSFSKTAITALLIVHILVFLWQRNTCWICFVSRVTTAAVILFFTFHTVTDTASWNKRLDLIGKSIQILKQSPLVGTGLGNYLIVQNTFPSSYPVLLQQPVHNIILLLAAETGIPLTLLVLFSVGFLFSRERKNVPLLLLGFAVFFTGMNDHYWITLHQNTLLLCVLFAIIQYGQKTSQHRR